MNAVLYLVATPIGNLEDITLRALHVLREEASVIACEDTRNSAQLLQRYGIDKPLIAAHQHNENEAATRLVARLREGERIAYISDAGTPGVSDPGARLVDAVRAAGLGVVPVPGASAVITALVAIVWISVMASSGAFALGTGTSSTTTGGGTPSADAFALTGTNVKSNFSQLVGAVGAATGATSSQPSLTIIDGTTTSSFDQETQQPANPSATVIPF